jgi:hypothetical protein
MVPKNNPEDYQDYLEPLISKVEAEFQYKNVAVERANSPSTATLLMRLYYLYDRKAKFNRNNAGYRCQNSS